MNEFYKVIVDVCTRTEWNDGQIPNATFVESLANAAYAPETSPSTAADLEGCEE